MVWPQRRSLEEPWGHANPGISSASPRTTEWVEDGQHPSAHGHPQPQVSASEEGWGVCGWRFRELSLDPGSGGGGQEGG